MGVGRDLEGRRLDGSRFPVTVSLNAVGDGDDRTVLAAVLDITERVAAEKDHARLEATLGQAQRPESVGQLAGGVAHDFNNILAMIMNYADFVAREVQGNPTVYDDVRQIQLAARRGADLIRQILLFSRTQVAAPQTLVLSEVLTEVRGLLDRSIGEHISLVVEYGPGVPAVRMERSRLEQVIVNLAVNARDAMPGGGRVAIDTAVAERSAARALGLDEARTYVRRTVANTGTGMETSVQVQAFDPFFTTKPRGQGTGLGWPRCTGW